MTKTEHINHDSHDMMKGLADNCKICRKHAKNIVTLDAQQIQRIWTGNFHTKLDIEAFNKMYQSLVTAQRIIEVFQYLRATSPDNTLAKLPNSLDISSIFLLKGKV